METRYLPTELRVDGEGRIEGYAAVFDQLSEVLWYFREKIRQGAFAKTLREADIRALFNHDPNYVLGRNRANNLELSEDDHGLHFRVEPPDTQWANDLRQSIQRGDIDQGSFAFDAIRDEWNYDVEPNERELIEVRLYDVSVVTYPAYPQTSVSARSLAEQFIRQMKDHTDPDTLAFLRNQLPELEAADAPGQEPHPEADGDDVEGADHAIDGDEVSEEVARARQRNSLRNRKLELERLKSGGILQ